MTDVIDSVELVGQQGRLPNRKWSRSEGAELTLQEGGIMRIEHRGQLVILPPTRWEALGHVEVAKTEPAPAPEPKTNPEPKPKPKKDKKPRDVEAQLDQDLADMLEM